MLCEQVRYKITRSPTSAARGKALKGVIFIGIDAFRHINTENCKDTSVYMNVAPRSNCDPARWQGGARSFLNDARPL